MYFYSPSENGFFTEEIHGTKMPPDARPLADSAYHALLAANVSGKRIVPDDRGDPMAVTVSRDTPDNARAFRDGELKRTDAMILRHREEVDSGTATTLSGYQFSELLNYRKQLREWPARQEFPAGRPALPECAK